MSSSALPNPGLHYWLERYKRDAVAQASVSFIASCLLIVILFLLAIRPTFITISNLRAQIEDMQLLNNNLNAKWSLLKKLYPQYQALEGTIPDVHEALPTDHQFSQYEPQLRVLINTYNLKLNSLAFSEFTLEASNSAKTEASTPAKSSTPKPNPKILVNLGVEGNYDQIKNFLKALQTLMRITTIEQVQILSNQARDADISLSLKGEVHYSPDKPRIKAL